MRKKCDIAFAIKGLTLLLTFKRNYNYKGVPNTNFFFFALFFVILELDPINISPLPDGTVLGFVNRRC